MSIASLTRRVSFGVVAALVLVGCAGAIFLWHQEYLRRAEVALLALKTHAEDLVDGANAFASFGIEPGMLESYENDALQVQKQLFHLGREFPSALAAAQYVAMLLRDARRIAAATQERAEQGWETLPDPFLAERLRSEIADHGFALRSSLVEAVTAASDRFIAASRFFSVALVAFCALLLGGILGAALLVQRRIGRPLLGLFESIRRGKDGLLVPAPDPGQSDEVGDVIAAFNQLVGQRNALEAEAAEHLEMLRMAGEIGLFGGWRYDRRTDRVTMSDGLPALIDEGPGFAPSFDSAIDYFEGADRQRMEDLNRDCLANGTTYDDVFQLRTAKGRLIWVRATAHPLLGDDGSIIGIYGALQDVSELREARVRAERQTQIAMEAQKHETIGRLTGGVAHDFNNLLAVILANLEMLRDEEPEPRRLRMIDSSIEALLRGAELTRSMLAFARRAPLEPQLLDLNEVARSTLKLAARILPSTIRLEFGLQAAPARVRADRAATESALLNLVVNANDAMTQGGSLAIETGLVSVTPADNGAGGEDLPPGNYVALTVRDTGTGMPPEVLAHIFEPFFTTKGPDGGSGIGLSMVQGFMTQSGGAVRVRSEHGVGTEFRLLFPEVDADGETEAAARTIPVAGTAAGGRILLVEDQPEVLVALGEMLEGAGYAVTCAASGDRAFELFAADRRFDLVVTDVVMPGTLQGPDLVAALRGMVPGLSAVFTSGYAGESTRAAVSLRPTDILLPKPVRKAQLLAAVARALRGPGWPPAP